MCIDDDDVFRCYWPAYRCVVIQPEDHTLYQKDYKEPGLDCDVRVHTAEDPGGPVGKLVANIHSLFVPRT